MSRPRKWAIGAVALLPGLYLLYLVVMNTVLMTGALSSFVNGRQDNVRVSSGRAWSYWFGAVHVRDLVIVIQEDDIEVMVAFPRARATLYPFELPDLVFHATEIRGEGGILRVRQRVPKADATEARMKGLPPIDGLGAPIIDKEVPADVDFSNNWTIRMHDIDAWFDEVWVDNYRLAGTIHALGQFEWAAAQWVRFEHTAVEVQNAHLEIAEQRVAEEVSLGVALLTDTLSQSPPVPATELLDRTNAVVRMSLTVSDPTTLQPFVPPDVSLALLGGKAQLEAAGAVFAGALSPGTYVDVQLSQWALAYEKWRSVTSGSARLDTDLTANTAAVDLPTAVRLAEQTGDGPLFSLDPARARLRWKDRHVVTLDQVPAMELAVIADAPSLAAVGLALGGHDPGISGGSARAELESRLGPEGRGTTSVKVRASELALTWAHRAYRGNIGTSATFQHDELTKGAGDGRFVLRDLYEKKKGEAWHKSVWFTEIDFTRLAFVMHDGEPSFTVALRGRAPDADPILDLPPLDEAIPDLPLALVDLEDLTFDAALLTRGDLLELKVYDASTDGVTLRGRMLLKDEAKTGAFYIDAPLIDFGIGISSNRVTMVENPSADWGQAHLAQLRRPTSAAKKKKGDKKP